MTEANKPAQPLGFGSSDQLGRALLTEKELLDIVDSLIRDAAYNRPAAVAIGMAVGAAVEAELRARFAALEYDASVGQRWRETSRLEDWFPLTAEELARLRATLLQCARMAEALKRECGPDPEGAQAVRNAEYQRISTTAHVALGTIRGAQLLMPREQIAMLWNSLPIDLEAEAIVSFVRGVERWHGLGA